MLDDSSRSGFPLLVVLNRSLWGLPKPLLSSFLECPVTKLMVDRKRFWFHSRQALSGKGRQQVVETPHHWS